MEYYENDKFENNMELLDHYVELIDEYVRITRPIYDASEIVQIEIRMQYDDKIIYNILKKYYDAGYDNIYYTIEGYSTYMFFINQDNPRAIFDATHAYSLKKFTPDGFKDIIHDEV